MRFLGLLFIISIIGAVLVLFTMSATPVVHLPESLTAIGRSTPITIRITAPHGVREANAYLEQNGARYELGKERQTVHRFRWPRNAPDFSWTVTAGTKAVPQLKDGNAQVVVEATSNDFRGASARVLKEVVVVTHPPKLSVDADQHYLYRGMADLVSFNVSGAANDSGVAVGSYRFRSWPMPGGKTGLFSLFAYPWDTPAEVTPVVFATDAGGTRVTSPIAVVFPKREQPKYRVRDLKIDDKFLQKVTDELDADGSGDLVARFIKINHDMRQANNKLLSDLRTKTEQKFLWSEPFQQQPNSTVESNYADLRNYFYQGRKIDEAVHLGYDLAVTQHVGVQASNDGRVIYAAPLGIYGNCIVVDHGYGLQSIYGHLSEIDVHEGDMVKKGQVMGKSGMTGLAGGDHIHFSMQLDGVQIDPREWWDAHWIHDHIATRMPLVSSPTPTTD
jgi:hypothetical protein